MMPDFSNIITRVAQYGYSSSQRAKLYGKLSTLMKNGMQLQAAVENLQKRAARKGRTDVEAIALENILEELQKGRDFSQAIQDYATVNERMILSAGENSGNLPYTLDLSAELLKNSGQMKSKVLGAVISPLFLISMLIGVLILLARVVMPKLTAVVEPSEWDTTARLLYKMTEIINSPWMFLVLFFLVLMLIAIGLSLPLWTGRGRAFCDRLPPWSMFRLLIGSGWIMSLASLVRSGETILNSLQGMRRVSVKNKWLYDRLNRTIFYYNSGLNLGEALEATGTDFPDKDIVDDLVTYSDMEGFDEILYSLGKEWVETGLEKINQQSAILNTGAIALVGVMLGWFTYAVVSIQMSLGSHFQNIGGM